MMMLTLMRCKTYEVRQRKGNADTSHIIILEVDNDTDDCCMEQSNSATNMINRMMIYIVLV
jgi:hypothetical protein